MNRRLPFRLRALAAAATLLLAGAAQASTITVNSVSDAAMNDGLCTLREAIAAANTDLPSGIAVGECGGGTSGVQDEIKFQIPGVGPHTLQPASALPDIVSSLSIDGYSQPGASANTISSLTAGFDAVIAIRIDGSQSGPASKPGLRIVGPGGSVITIKGLEIFGYASPGCCADAGIVLAGQATNVAITGNIIRNNNWRAIFANGGGSGHSNILIGGPLASERNLIHSIVNTEAVALSTCTSCVVENNWIGLSRNGTQAIAAGNLIGVQMSGTPLLEVRDNWIAGNTFAGVSITSQTSTIRIRDNLIGGSFANMRGIRVSNNNSSFPSDNSISGNVITGNTLYGVGYVNFNALAGMVRNTLTRNRIYANGGLEVDLGGDGGDVNGVSVNDPTDADVGPNNVQNYPQLSAPVVAGAQISIDYDINSADVQYTLEFSFSTLCDASGHGPAGVMQADPVQLPNMPVAGTATFELPVAHSGFVSAMATGPDGNGEFSACQPYVFVDPVFANGFE